MWVRMWRRSGGGRLVILICILWRGKWKGIVEICGTVCAGIEWRIADRAGWLCSLHGSGEFQHKIQLKRKKERKRECLCLLGALKSPRSSNKFRDVPNLGEWDDIYVLG